MKITVIGCGRFGTFIAWYLDSIGHHVSLYGRETSKHMEQLMIERRNEFLSLPDSVALTTDLQTMTESEVIVISINAQGRRGQETACRCVFRQSDPFLLRRGFDRE